MKRKGVSRSTFQRLPGYLTYLKSLEPSVVNISARTIAEALALGEVQVRKDLASVSDAGKPKVGYEISGLIQVLECFLGYDNIHDAFIVGAGHLGKALLDYSGFSQYGLNIICGFDTDAAPETLTDTGKQIFHLSKFPDLCERMKVQIGIITVPATSAQAVCDLMIEHGIVAIWNFAPTHLKVPSNILVRNENLAASFAVLAKEINAGRNDNEQSSKENEHGEQ